MRMVSLTICAAAVSASIALGSLSAGAEETATLSNCVKMASQVNQALASNAQSASYEAAMKEKGYGRDFCLNGLYANGVAHYDQALKLLGVSKD